MSTERSPIRNTVKVFACCTLLGVGVFSNLPIDLRTDSKKTASLRGAQLIRPINEGMFMLPTNETHDYAGFQHNASEYEEDGVKLDFFVSGFPKCGTTTLLKTFEQHDETVVPHMEECSLDQVFQDDFAYTRLMDHLKNATDVTDSSSDGNVKRGIKCPFGLTTKQGIERLESWFPNTRLIFGLRHPVTFFQSYYNYRVLEVNIGKIEGPIPSPESLIGSNDWIRVSTDYARYEAVLEKLGKTEASNEPATPFKIFLYTLEQMEDDDDDRRAKLRETLGTFLQLDKPIEPLPHANTNPSNGGDKKEGFKETINICDSEHDRLRGILVENGKKTQEWILQEFLASPDVIVANEGHFRDIVSQWGTDPCVKNDEENDTSSEAEE